MSHTHRTRNLLAALLLVLLAASPLAAQDWAGRGRANGNVTDEAGRPIEGAKITLHRPGQPEAGPEPIYTNKKGRWSFLGLGHGAWTVLIDAEGYLPAEGPYNVNEFGAAPDLEVELTRSPTASIDKGDRLLDAGDPAGARDAYREAMEGLDPTAAARLHSRIGDTYLQESQWGKAREEYALALPHIAPGEQAHIRIQLATSYQQEGNNQAARAELEKALPLLEPEGQAEVLKSIARMWDEAGQRDNAIESLKRALELQPENVELIQLTADLLTRAGREEEASQVLARLPEGTKLPADMLLNIGIQAYNEGNLDKALENFDRAVKENADMAEAYYYRGLVYLGKEENEKAIADFEKLIQMAPEGAQAAEAKEFLAFLKPSE